MASEAEKDPLDLLGTGEANNKLNEEQRKQRERDLGDVRKVLSLPEGRRFIWARLSNAGIFHDIFTNNSNQTAHDLGRRKEGLDLLKLVTAADPEAYARMMREHISEAKSKEKVS